jgi:hypothetical protein
MSENDSILVSIDNRLSSLESLASEALSMMKRSYELGVSTTATGHNKEHSAKSTEDVSDVLTKIRSGLAGVISSPDENTHTELSALVAGLQDAKKRLSDISDKIADGASSDDGSDE